MLQPRITTMNDSWILRLPTPIIQLIYEYDPTFHEVLRKTVAEFKFLIRNTDRIQLRLRYYENIPGTTCISYNGQLQKPIYRDVPYFLSKPSHTRSNIFKSIDLYCFRFPLETRIEKRESIRSILAYKNMCKQCGKTGVSASRYKLVSPVHRYLFCGYSCHQQYYMDGDQIQYRMMYYRRPIFDQYGIAIIAECSPPNYWRLRPEDEQWEIVWMDGSHPLDRPIVIGVY